MTDKRSEAAIRDDADTVRLSANVPRWVVYWLDQYAAAAGAPRAEMVRRALVQFVGEVAVARGGILCDSEGKPRADLFAPDAMTAEVRTPAQPESLARGRDRLVALPQSGDGD